MTYKLPITKAMLEKAKRKKGGVIITVDGSPEAVLLSIEEYREYESLKEPELWNLLHYFLEKSKLRITAQSYVKFY